MKLTRKLLTFAAIVLLPQIAHADLNTLANQLSKKSNGVLEFQSQEIEVLGKKMQGIVPKTWKKMIPWVFADKMNKIEYGYNCDGACEAKDWAKISEKVSFSAYRDSKRFKIIKEETLSNPSGKLMIVESLGSFPVTYVKVARWQDKSIRYVDCGVDLNDDQYKSLVSVFEELCTEVTASGSKELGF